MEINRSDLALRIADQCQQLTASDIEQAVKTILRTMTDSLCHGRRIEIRGFGSFSLHYRNARIARNPKTGERVELAGKYVPYFKASRELSRRVNLRSMDILS